MIVNTQDDALHAQKIIAILEQDITESEGILARDCKLKVGPVLSEIEHSTKLLLFCARNLYHCR